MKWSGVGWGTSGVRGVAKEWRIFIQVKKKNPSDRMRKEVKCTEKKRTFE